jgi:cholesterol oxidase
VITSTIRIPDALDGGSGRGAYIQDGGYPYFASWLAEGANLPGLACRALGLGWRYLAGLLRLDTDSNLSAEISSFLGTAESSSTLTLLGMGRDVPGGRVRLDGKWLDIDWPRASSRPFFNALREKMRQIADVHGGRLIDNPLWYLGRTVTVHPLGGCPMGLDAKSGVVDSFGEVFGHPGLFVADGSVMPGPVGPNPSLTIAALADRFARHAAAKWKRAQSNSGVMS